MIRILTSGFPEDFSRAVNNNSTHFQKILNLGHLL